jgi:organic radical activating enzyme
MPAGRVRASSKPAAIQPDKLAMVLPVADVAMDIKLPSNTGEPAFWDDHVRFLAAAGGKAYVKILVDGATAIDEVERAAELICRHAPGAPVFLQPITSPSGRVALDRSALDRCFTALREHLADVRVLPQTHRMLGIQ